MRANLDNWHSRSLKMAPFDGLHAIFVFYGNYGHAYIVSEIK